MRGDLCELMCNACESQAPAGAVPTSAMRSHSPLPAFASDRQSSARRSLLHH